MLNTRNLIILKKYKDSHHIYYTDKIFKTFIVDLYYKFIKVDKYNCKRLFAFIFIHNILKYLYDE